MACTTCADGYFKLQSSDTCVDRCPSGTQSNNDECVLADDINVVFTNKNINISIEGLIFQSSTDKPPMNLWQRGLYFGGYSAMKISNLMFNNAMTIRLWVLP